VPQDTVVEVQMPQMGESVTEGTILEWHVAEGEEVAEGDTVVEVSTDKIDAEVPAPASGVVTKILAQPDDTVEVGQALAQIDPNGARSDNGASADPSPLKESEGLVMGGGEGDEDLGDDAAATGSPQPGVTETPTPDDERPSADPAAPGREAEEAAGTLVIAMP
jgi:pyruvate/2-oxoglutarate dehydrogenase complex dihydrolipoamide acyltransferase (E2) component